MFLQSVATVRKSLPIHQTVWLIRTTVDSWRDKQILGLQTPSCISRYIFICFRHETRQQVGSFSSRCECCRNWCSAFLSVVTIVGVVVCSTRCYTDDSFRRPTVSSDGSHPTAVTKCWTSTRGRTDTRTMSRTCLRRPRLNTVSTLIPWYNTLQLYVQLHRWLLGESVSHHTNRYTP